MKIGLFTDTYSPEINGVAVSTEMLRTELSKRGHEVYVFTVSNPGAKRLEEGIYRLPSVPLMVLPSRRVGSFVNPRLAEMIQNTGLDIVHSQTEFSLGIFCKQIVGSIRVPHVHTYHTIYEEYTHYVTRGLLDGQTKKAARALSRYYCNGCDSLITPSDKTRDLLRSYGVTKPIDVVPTGIDIARFDPKNFTRESRNELRASFGIGPDNPVLINIGRISKEKNIQSVLSGLPSFFAKHPDAYFVSVGDGPYVADLRAQAETLEISKYVIFAGERPWTEIGKFYNMGDVFISASVSETQGITYIEAMSSGLAVVAKADPVIEGLIVDGDSGLLFNEEGEIADTLERAFFDTEYRKGIIQNAHAKAEGYSSKVFGERVEAIYEGLVRQRKQGV